MKRLFSAIITFILAFTAVFSVACSKEGNENEFSVYCPDGAPSLSIAKFIEDTEDFGTGEEFSYNVVSANEINNAILKHKAGFVIMPINSATRLYKEKGGYKMAAVLTHGNFYVMSKTELSSAEDLIGKVIYVPQRGKVPDLTLQASLKALNIHYEEGDTAKSGVVVLNYKYATPNELVPFMLTSQNPIIGLIPEPAATNLSKKNIPYQLSLQEMFDSEEAYPQAVLLVKKSVLRKHPNVVTTMSSLFSANLESTLNSPANAVTAIKANFGNSTLAENLTRSAVEGCNIYWQNASLAKPLVSAYIERIRALDSAFINLVGDDFYL